MGQLNENNIVLDPSCKGIVLEKREKFKHSIFSDVYKNAMDLVVKIVQAKTEANSAREKDDFCNKERDNIITFVGRRGTGKTSAMLSFMEELKKHNSNYPVLEQDKKGEYSFIGLEWIDASMLEDSEEIFEAILIKMYGEFLAYSEELYVWGDQKLEVEKKELYRQFEHIHKHFVHLKHGNEGANYNKGNSLAILRDLAGSDKIRTDFAELVKLYIKFKKSLSMNRNYLEDKTYMLIAIDDIDLNIENGYDILEQIHRYLMVPGVIVLISINYEEMMLCCEKHYVKSYKMLRENEKFDIFEHAQENSEKYLEKVLPRYMRLYMPSLKKKDYSLLRQTKIKLEGVEYGNVKDAIFALSWKKTGIFYDSQGKKRHFIEPETLRNLSNIYELYTAMTVLPSNKHEDAYLHIYDRNYKELLNDLLFRFAVESLPSDEYKYFVRWSEEDIERRGKYVVEKVLFWLDEADLDEEDEIISSFRYDYYRARFSYGELLRALFILSRYSGFVDRKGRKKNKKRLVHVLLSQYTIALSWIYQHSVYGKKENQVEFRGVLDKMMETSIGGSFLSTIKIKILDKDYGGLEKGSTIYAHQLYTSTMKDGLFTIESKFYEKISEATLYKDIEKIISSQEFEPICVLLFFLNNFSSSKGSGKQYKIQVQKCDHNSDYKMNIVGGVTFNALNFVNNAYKYQEVFERIYIGLAKAICDERNLGNKFEDIEKNAKLFVEQNQNKDKKEANEHSLLYDFKKWYNMSYGFALPTYNFDITYNLIKRLVIEGESGIFLDNDKCTAIGALRNMFVYMESALDKQDKFYLEKIDQECESRFSKYFTECPIVKYFKTEKINSNEYVFEYILCGTVWHNLEDTFEQMLAEF